MKQVFKNKTQYCINILSIPSIKKPKFSLFFLSCTYASFHPLSVLSSLSLAPLSPSFPCGFSSLLVVMIRIEIEFWVCGGCDRVLVFVFVHTSLVVVVVVVDFGYEFRRLDYGGGLWFCFVFVFCLQ